MAQIAQKFRQIFQSGDATPERALRTISIAEQIAEELASDILQKRVKVGSRLGEEAIAARFGVSRGPVRSALRILEKKGLAEFFPRRGAFVSELSFEGLRGVMEIRFWLLVLAVRVCAGRLTQDAENAISEARSLLRGQIDNRSVDANSFAANTSALFRVFVVHSGNEMLPEMLDLTLENSAWNLVWLNLEIDFRSTERRREVFKVLDEMCDAVIAGDEKRAEREARRFLDDSMRTALEAWQKAASGRQ